MPFNQSEALSLLRVALEHLEEVNKPLLASFEDCDYFRKTYAPPLAKQESRPSPPKPVEIAKPPLEPKPTPIAAAAPALRFKEDPPKAAPPPPEPIKPEPPSAPLPAVRERFEDLRSLWSKINPGAPLFDEAPSDEIAKKIATRWKTKNITAEISILAYHEPPAQRALLEQIAKAIDATFGPARIVQADPIEKEKQWEAFLSVPHLKLTIACDYTLWQLGGLMHHYREIPAQNTRHLGSVPVFLLPDLSLYLKDPLLKRSLWKALCQTLS